MAKRDGTVDLRIKRTQKSIKNAFYELIEEKGFDHISVKDITERAMISRNTFYLHYNDKFDFRELGKMAIDFSDGVIAAEADSNATLMEYAKTKGIPTLDYAGEDFTEAYKAFLEQIAGE